jgi:predicted HicB family RNase H-like nuclease
MDKTQIVTSRVPAELKTRLAHEAKAQGVSLNNLANSFLTTS